MESIIVKLNSAGEYFYVSFNPSNRIEEVKLVKNKDDASLFQRDSLIIENENGNKISLGANRMAEFSLYCFSKGIGINDITIEKIDAPEQHFLTNKQMEMIKTAMYIIIA